MRKNKIIMNKKIKAKIKLNEIKEKSDKKKMNKI